MPKLLQAAGPLGKAGWAPFQTLLVAQLQFLEPYLRTARLHESVRLLYQARILILDHRSPLSKCPCHRSLAFDRHWAEWIHDGAAAPTPPLQHSASALALPLSRSGLDLGAQEAAFSSSVSSRPRAPSPGP